MYIQTMCKRE